MRSSSNPAGIAKHEERQLSSGRNSPSCPRPTPKRHALSTFGAAARRSALQNCAAVWTSQRLTGGWAVRSRTCWIPWTVFLADMSGPRDGKPPRFPTREFQFNDPTNWNQLVHPAHDRWISSSAMHGAPDVTGTRVDRRAISLPKQRNATGELTALYSFSRSRRRSIQRHDRCPPISSFAVIRPRRHTRNLEDLCSVQIMPPTGGHFRVPRASARPGALDQSCADHARRRVFRR